MPIVTGTAGADRLQGSAGADTLLGLGGDDTLLAGAGLDSLDGGAGDDTAVVDRGGATTSVTLFILIPSLTTDLAGTTATGVENFSVTAGAGDDGLVGGAGRDTLLGGAGADALSGGGGADSLSGGDGADTLAGGAGADMLAGGAGADLLLLQLGTGGADGTLAAPDRILDFSAAEGDRLALRGQSIGAALLPVGGRSFGLTGIAPLLPLGFAAVLAPRTVPQGGMALPNPASGEAHVLHWQPGLAAGGWLLLDLDADGILGEADLVVRLELPAGSAITTASFLAGSFATLGTPGADSLAGSAEADSLLGFAGADSLAGGGGDDTLAGGAGADSLSGGAGLDSLLGGDAADTLDGGAGTDVLDGGAGEDSLLGGAGDDVLLGGSGADTIEAGDGDDSLEGGSGADSLRGGAGADTYLLQAMGEAAWSSLDAMDTVMGFSRAEGDRLRLSDAWSGAADGAGANAGTYTGADGIARALVFAGSTGRALAPGMPLPARPLGGVEAYQLFFLPGTGGGWLVLDLDRDARLGTADLVVRLEGVGVLAPEDFYPGSFLSLAGSFERAGTPASETLLGGSLGEVFLGSGGSDLIAGGVGAGNGLSYAGLGGPIAAALIGRGAGEATKPGGARDRFTDIHSLTGTAGADTLDAAAAEAGLFTITLEGLGGADRIIGTGDARVQASYAASPAAVQVDLQGGTAADGWGTTDTLVNIRRIVATSAFGDTVLGSAGDDVFLSGAAGNKSFDGRAGADEWRYTGTGAVTVILAPPGNAAGYALKPGGTDRLTGVEVITAGAGDDSLYGSGAEERFAGGAGRDTIDGGNGFDTASYDGGLPSRGAVVDLTAGTATDPWGDADTLRNIENAWGSALGDDLTGFAIAGAYTWLRGLAGNDTLRAPAAGSWVGADYAGDPGGITASLATGEVTDGWGGTDTLMLLRLIRGSGFADRISGGAAAESLFGGAGDDTLDGGGGADWLEGGAGDDRYLVNDPAVVVVEAAGGGRDTLVAGIPFTLPAFVEVLQVLPGVAFASGNDQDNLILGSEAADQLHGGSGQDSLQGGEGADTLFGSPGDDRVEGGGGADVLTGNAGADTLSGGEGDDNFVAEADGSFPGTLVLDVGDGAAIQLVLAGASTHADSLDGGAGRDQWIGTAAADLLDFRATARATGVEVFAGGAGADALLLAPGMAAATLAGGDGADTLSGTGAGDLLEGEAGADVLAGQAGDDTLRGGAGDDILRGAAGADALEGGPGRDALFAGAGNDTLTAADADALLDGGAGWDVLILDRSGATGPIELALADRLVEAGGTSFLAGLEQVSATGGAGDDRLAALDGADTLRGGLGRDTLEGAGGADSLDGGAGDDALEAGEGADTLEGGAGSDWLSGGAGADRLDGGDGADSLEGGAGADTMAGGEGADTLVGGAGAELIQAGAGADSLDGGEGGDTLQGEVGQDLLAGGTGDDLLNGGDGSDLLDGGDGADTLQGEAGNDTQSGGAGADLLDAGAGDDLLEGGDGADTLQGGEGADTLISGDWDPVLDGGPGIDLAVLDRSDAAGPLIISAGSISDGLRTTSLSGIEILVLITGGGADSLTGGAEADTLRGGDGADTLEGGAGTDWLYGGPGDDLFRVDRQDDLAFERSAEGQDTVLASAGYYLWPSLEVLWLAPAAGDAFAVGNELDNLLRGNDGSNLLIGWDGADTVEAGGGVDALFGVAGADSLSGGAGIDYLVGGEGADTLDGGADPDSLYGQDGNDLLIGGAHFSTDIMVAGDGQDTLDGASGLGDYDLMDGGAGDDIYWVDTPFDLTFEGVGGGRDTVIADIRGAGFYLWANTEVLILRGETPFGVGNELANWLVGSAATNWLLGGAGDDTLDGGGGDDVLFGEAGADVFLLRRAPGAVVIGDFTPGIDRLRCIDLGFADAAALLAATDQHGDSSAIRAAEGLVVVLIGVAKAALSPGDFLFG